MKLLIFVRCWLFLIFAGLAGVAFAQMDHAQHKMMHSKAELGVSVAIDAQGQLWMVSREALPESLSGPTEKSVGTEKSPVILPGAYIVLQKSVDGGRSWSAPQRIIPTPEAVSADGENRPKLAFGSKGEFYIAYTRPLTKLYTGEIRFVRSVDGGFTFSAPVTVHQNHDEITHRFESMAVDKAGRIYIAWIDKRDAEAAKARKEKYVGAAIYYAVSSDAGISFNGDVKVAEHSCECCRIALELNELGRPVALWRHVFASNTRDHALVELTADGVLPSIERATFDNWQVDACPHQGPSVAFSANGTRYQTWFSVRGEEGGVFYAAIDRNGKSSIPVRLGTEQAEHAEVAVQGSTVVIVWKQFDGKATTIIGQISQDGGATWQQAVLAATTGNSDHPHLLNTMLSSVAASHSGIAGIVLVWNTQIEGVRVIRADVFNSSVESK